jgi:hypothetical protein
MDKLIAERILKAALSLDNAFGDIDSAIHDLIDHDEKRAWARKLGDALRIINENFIIPITEKYPELDEEK